MNPSVIYYGKNVKTGSYFHCFSFLFSFFQLSSNEMLLPAKGSSPRLVLSLMLANHSFEERGTRALGVPAKSTSPGCEERHCSVPFERFHPDSVLSCLDTSELHLPPGPWAVPAWWFPHQCGVGTVPKPKKSLGRLR